MKSARAVLVLGLAAGVLVGLGSCGREIVPIGADSVGAGSGSLVLRAAFPTPDDQIALYKEKYGTAPPPSEVEASTRALSRFVDHIEVVLSRSGESPLAQIIASGMEASFGGIPSGLWGLTCTQKRSDETTIPQVLSTQVTVPDGWTDSVFVYFIDGWESADNASGGALNLTPPDSSFATSGDHTLQRNTDGAGSDDDWFKFQVDPAWVSRGDFIRITTMNLLNCDTVMYLYASDAVTEIGYNDDSLGLASRLDFQPASAGWYYVKISPFGSYDRGAYDLVVSDLPAGQGGGGGGIVVYPG